MDLQKKNKILEQLKIYITAHITYIIPNAVQQVLRYICCIAFLEQKTGILPIKKTFFLI